MKSKLELKHLAAYLPYDLKVFSGDGRAVRKLTSINAYKNTYSSLVQLSQSHSRFYEQNINYCNPILRPLSDIYNFKYKPRYGNNECLITEVMPIETIAVIECGYINEILHDWFDLLVKHHFDVFRLIEKGLAIDINTL